MGDDLDFWDKPQLQVIEEGEINYIPIDGYGIPAEWSSAYYDVIGYGRKPSSVVASIEYITTQKSQREAADKFGVSEHTIAHNYKNLLSIGPVDEMTKTRHTTRTRTRAYQQDVVGALDMKEGEHYKEKGENFYLLKEGWKVLHSEVVDSDE